MANKVQIIFEALNRSDRAMSEVESQVKKIGSAANVAQKAFGLLGVGIAGLSLDHLRREVMNAGLAWERMQNSMKAATGSTEAAASGLEFVRAEANRLGLDLQTAGGAFAQLSAAAKGSGLAARDVRGIFSAVGEATTVLGLSAYDAEGAMRAIVQIMSKGTVQAEELRGQLGERIPGAFQIAARAMDVSTQELNKMLEQGQVLSKEFLPRFASELRKTFKDALPDAVDSANARLQRFETQLFDIKVQFAESGFLDGLVDGLDAVSEVLKDEEFQSALKEAGRGFGELAAGMLKTTAAVGSFSARAFDDWARWLKEIRAYTGVAQEEVSPEDVSLGLQMLRNRHAPMGPGRQPAGTDEAPVPGYNDLLNPSLGRLPGISPPPPEVPKPPPPEEELSDLQKRLEKDALEGRNFYAPGFWETQARERIETEKKTAEALYKLNQQLYADIAALGEAEGRKTPKDSWLVKAEDLEAVQERAKTAAQELEEWERNLEEGMNAMSQFGIQAARNIQSAFADFLFDPVEDGFEGMVAKFGDALRRMAAEAASAKILGDLFDGMAGSGIGLFAAFGKFMGGSVDAYHDGGKFVPTFHFGGLSSDEGLAVLKKGERTFDPEQTRIVDGLARLGQMAAGEGTTVQVFNNGPGEARTERSRGPDGREMIRVFIEATKREMALGGFDSMMSQSFGLVRRGA